MSAEELAQIMYGAYARLAGLYDRGVRRDATLDFTTDRGQHWLATAQEVLPKLQQKNTVAVP